MWPKQSSELKTLVASCVQLGMFQTGRKLSAHDLESELAVYVAMDMLVVIDDLSKSQITTLLYLQNV